MAAADQLRRLIRRAVGDEAIFAGFRSAAAAIEERPPPFIARAVLFALLAFIVALIVWASLAQVDQIVIAQGRIVTSAQTIVIQPLETAVVRELRVRVGQNVKKGEIVATLDPTFSSADAAQIRQRRDSLGAEIARLEAESRERRYVAAAGNADAALQADMYDKRAAEYGSRIKSFQADIARLDADLRGTIKSREALKARLDSVRQIEKMKDDLKEKQFVSPMAVLESREKRLEVETAYEDSVNKSQQLREQLAQARHNQEAFVKQWRQKILEDLVKAQRERDALQEQLTKAERRNTLVELASPLDATVLEIHRRSAGSVAKEAEPLLTLVPADSPLEAEIQIAADDIGFVRKGDVVRVKIDAFPFQKHGSIDGTLIVVGADSFLAEGGTGGAAAASNARAGNRAFFPGRVAGFSNTLIRVPPDTRLTPGMTLTAEIKIGRRSVISYFLYPLIKAFDESIRRY
ncbi:MAG: HlyD family type I secretion periplasmic adaptor subunit [Burkholderiales bacterium]|nr:HlyD family type I secretion periplasmic adaptor subunit [Burkholderiales bacterium]